MALRCRAAAATPPPLRAVRGRCLHWSARRAAAAPADTYTHGHHKSVVGMHAQRTAEDCAGYLLPHLAAGQRLLDVGCGPGTITRGLAERVAGDGGHATAIDTVEAVLDQAREALAATPNASVAAASVYELPYDDASFDVVHAHQVLQHLSEPVAALREMRRVCAPGGLLAVRDADYATMRGVPEPPCGGIERWRTVYCAVRQPPTRLALLEHWVASSTAG